MSDIFDEMWGDAGAGSVANMRSPYQHHDR
jgi:hypothetical protein